MQVSDALSVVESELARTPGFELPRLQAELLVAAAIDLPTSELKQQGHRTLNDKEQTAIQRYLGAPSRIPVPLFLGYCEVEGLRFCVSGACLLPGTETAAFIQLASELVTRNGVRTIVEMGTGTGVVAISLARAYPDCRVIATDISEEACHLARQNAAALGVERSVEVRTGSWYDPLAAERLQGCVDLIISNPPYCRTDAIPSLPRGFAMHAPYLAIDGGDNGLRGHLAVIQGSLAFLRLGGHILLQTDAGQSDSVANCISQTGGYDRVHFADGSDGDSRFVFARRTRSTL